MTSWTCGACVDDWCLLRSALLAMEMKQSQSITRGHAACSPLEWPETHGTLSTTSCRLIRRTRGDRAHVTACRMQDQLIVFMVLARGQSRMLCRTPSLHTRTAIAVAQQLTGAQFHVEACKHDLALISCCGAASCATGDTCD